MGDRRGGVAIAVCGVLMMGCAATPKKSATSPGYAADGAVSAEVLERPSAARYPTAPGVSYSGSAPSRDNPNPEYPAGLLARLLPPVTVMVRVVVGGDGAVSSASIIEPASEDAAFGDATLAAVRAWTFDPLRRVTVTDGKSEALPFTREFRFTFRQVNGHAVVDNVQ